jgi:hypothetical protein
MLPLRAIPLRSAECSNPRAAALNGPSQALLGQALGLNGETEENQIKSMAYGG